MRYSQSTELAIDSLFYMAKRGPSSDFSVEEVAQAQHVSVSYLAKIFQQLVKAGLLRSHRGSKGGYALGRLPAQISLRDISVVFEGSSPLYECNANAKRCALGPKCLIMATFCEAEKKMQEVLGGVSLQDVVNHTANETGGWIPMNPSQHPVGAQHPVAAQQPVAAVAGPVVQDENGKI